MSNRTLRPIEAPKRPLICESCVSGFVKPEGFDHSCEKGGTVNILVLGNGGREHALAWALAKSPQTERLYVAPGNGGTVNVAENVAGLDASDGAAVLAFVREHRIGLVVIGPEAPLVSGVADVLRAAGVAVFGPDAQDAVKFLRDNGSLTPVMLLVDKAIPTLYKKIYSLDRKSVV